MLFRALVLGHIRGNGLRAFVTVVAVALGVAIALAIDLANATAVASFATSVNVVANQTNLQVLGIGRGFSDRTILRVQQVPGVRYAAPTIEDSLLVDAHPDQPFSGDVLRVLGIDMLRPLPGVDAASLRGPAPDPDILVNGHGALISERIAGRHGWRVGMTVHALAGDRDVRLRIAGILPPALPGVDSSVVFVDIATAQELFAKRGLLDRIDCIVDPAQLAAAQAAIARVIPPGTRAIEPAVRTGEIRRMLQSFQLNLAALSYIALLVGMYLIYNTIAISVVQRRAEIGTLRALGATRGAVFRTFLAEGALFGVVGGLAGLTLGTILAQLSVGAVSRTVDTLYVASHADRVLFDPLVFLETFAAGVASAIVSALIPAFDAASTLPALTMRTAGFERRIPRFARRALAAAGGLFLVAFACSRAPAIGGVPLFGYLAGLALIAAGSLCAPAALALAVAVTRRIFVDRAPAGRLAAADLGSSPVRTSVAIASLMTAIAMMISIAILIGSFRTTVVAWANDTLKADLFVKPLGLADASFDARFSPAVATTIARLPGVAAVDTFRGIAIPFRGRITTLAATDFSVLGARKQLRFLGLANPAALARDLPGTLGVLISEPFATRFGIGPGERFTLPSPSGPLVLRVAAVYNDYSSDGGVVLLDRRTYTRAFHDDSLNSIAVYAKPGVDLLALRGAIVRSVLPLRIDAETTRELRALVVAIFNRTFAITYALYIISIAIAVLGVVSTLFALVLERRREIGLLRYLGMRTRDVRRMVYAEAGLIGLLGGLLGAGLGVVLSLLLIFVINRQAFGWLIELHIPYDFLVEAVVLVIAVAVLAGIYPASVAARIRTAEAVRTE